MKTIIYYSAGGLGNILYGLLRCLYYFEEKKFNNFVISWNNQIGYNCNYNDLFKKNNFISEIIDNIEDYGAFVPKNVLAKFKDVINVHVNYNNMEKLDEKNICALLSGQYINMWREHNISNKTVYKLINKYIINLFNDELVDKAKIFMSNNGLVINNYISLHIRKTDSPLATDDFFLNQINKILKSRPNIKIFLCSDDSDTETFFKNSYKNNIIIRPKKHQPIMNNKFPRRASYKDIHTGFKKLGYNNADISLKNLGNKTTFNIWRNKETCQEGVIDFLLLSYSIGIIKNMGSTYSDFAQLIINARNKDS